MKTRPARSDSTCPKGADLSGYSQEQLMAIADQTNGRPRKTLDWASPLKVDVSWLARLRMQSNTIQ